MTTRRLRRARLAGALLQGVGLGTLLFLALARLATLAADARVFTYQGF